MMTGNGYTQQGIGSPAVAFKTTVAQVSFSGMNFSPMSIPLRIYASTSFFVDELVSFYICLYDKNVLYCIRSFLQNA